MVKNLVILHGWNSNKANWVPLINILKNSFKIYFPDLPGFGKTKITKAYDLEDYCFWLKSYLSKNKINNPVILAHSFGGRIAVKYTSNCKSCCQSLILINAAGIKRKKSFKKIIAFCLAKTGRFIFKNSALSIIGSLIKKGFYKILGEQDYYRASEIMKQTLIKVINEDLRLMMKKISCPTLIIWGEQDRITPLRDGRMMASLITNSSLITIKGCGHNLPFIKPKLIAENIIRFT